MNSKHSELDICQF